ncbi:ketopantoate reductase [Myxococcota bacterium]|nr:ketopantoate reductase [Myxococcota bacterium]
MKVLLVGAGAVGQVFGRHLQKGGAEIHFFVREKYAQEARQGYWMAPWDRKDPLSHPVRLEGFGVLTTLEEVRQTRWQQVYLCVSSAALRVGWIEELAQVLGDAVVIALQPGVHDRDLLHRFIEPERLVMGTVGFLSYHAPLSDESVLHPCTAYWFPPLSPTPFSSPSKENCRSVVEALKRGKLPAIAVRDIVGSSAYISALLMHLVAALECNGWSCEQLARSPDLQSIRSATLEVFYAFQDSYRPPLPLWLFRLLLRPIWMRLGLAIAPKIVPFSIERFLQVHFSKVGDQTLLMLADSLAFGQQRGLSMPALFSLSERLRQQRAKHRAENA